jgi:hypothetical protein
MPGTLSVLTFNYDRSFERFFLDALEAGFRLRPETARSVFGRIDLFHVYGDLGSLEEIPYGDLSLLYKSAGNIKLARMQSEDENRVKINKMLAAAQNVCFIGFSFAAENVALFDIAALQGKKLVATSLGMSGAREQEVRKTFRGIKFFDGTADELLNNQNIFEGPNVAVPKDHLPVKPRRSNWMRDVLGDSPWRVRLQ